MIDETIPDSIPKPANGSASAMANSFAPLRFHRRPTKNSTTGPGPTPNGPQPTQARGGIPKGAPSAFEEKVDSNPEPSALPS